MGSKYTKAEKQEFLTYKAIIDRAIFERERYNTYKEVRVLLNKKLLDKTK